MVEIVTQKRKKIKFEGPSLFHIPLAQYLLKKNTKQYKKIRGDGVFFALTYIITVKRNNATAMGGGGGGGSYRLDRAKNLLHKLYQLVGSSYFVIVEPKIVEPKLATACTRSRVKMYAVNLLVITLVLLGGPYVPRAQGKRIICNIAR